MKTNEVLSGDESVSAMDCHHAAKWAAVVDDTSLPMPQQHVAVSVIKAQAGLSPDFVLVRDHNSPEDVVLDDNGSVDLAAGNVFYRLRRCEVEPRGTCHAPPKLAFLIDDRPEVTIRSGQTGKTLLELFSIALNAHLFRDRNGSDDPRIGLDTPVNFTDGPVFYTREVEARLAITVNAWVFTDHDGVKVEMTGREIAALVYPDNAGDTSVWFTSDGNREVGLDETIKIRGCEVFEVIRKNVTGGYESERLHREIEQLRLGGLLVTLISEPSPAVIYHDLRAAPGGSGTATDVLVPVPSAYPGQFIDWAYLPQESALIGRVKGQPQDHRINALGRVWRQISYHPHNGGGGPVWNPGRHGFHTYFGELLSWLRSI